MRKSFEKGAMLPQMNLKDSFKEQSERLPFKKSNTLIR